MNDKLVVVSMEWWLERYIYDGKEVWVYIEMPSKPKGQKINLFYNRNQ